MHARMFKEGETRVCICKYIYIYHYMMMMNGVAPPGDNNR